MVHLTKEQAEQVYAILLEYGAKKDERTKSDFVAYVTKPDRWGHEYRFCGIFGMGGKVRVNYNGEVTADMYRENETPELVKQMDQLNAELSTFKAIVG